MVNSVKIFRELSNKVLALYAGNSAKTSKAVSKASVLIHSSAPGRGNGYSRLKGVFRSGQNYKHYDEIVLSAKNKIVGNIPDELIELIVKNHPERKAELIKSVQNAFGETAETLKLCQLAQLDAVKAVKGAKAEKDFILHVFSKGAIGFNKSKEEIQMLKIASKELNGALKGILPKGSKAKISHIGEGCFGNGYKLEIIDSAGDKIMHDRVLKVYKDINLTSEFEKIKIEKYKELLAKYSEEQLWKVLPEKIKQGIKKEEFLAKIKHIKNNITTLSADKCSQDINSFMSNYKHMHGVNAEANSVTRLKHILGHDISRTNAVNTDMFDVGKGYALSQYSDGTLPKVVNEINFNRLGLKARDLHKNNLVNGRIIDFGAITGANEALLDKTVLKYYKQIMNRNNAEERLEVMFRLKRLAEAPKTPLRNKIQKAVDIAQNELLFSVKKDGEQNLFPFQMPVMKKIKQDKFVKALNDKNKFCFKGFDKKEINEKFAKIKVKELKLFN